MKVYIFLLLAVLALSTPLVSAAQYNKVRLQDVQVLTFRKGEWTTGRRSSPVQQMVCVGGPGQRYSDRVKSIQCRNVGFDGMDVNWKCEAVLPNGLDLGKTEVTCEGFDYPEDPFVLAGSCGIEYQLKGRPVQTTPSPSPSPQPVQNTYNRYEYRNHHRQDDSLSFAVVFGLIFVTIYCATVCCWVPTRPSGRYNSRRSRTTTTTTTTPTPPPYNPGVAYNAPPQPQNTHTHTHTEVHHHNPSSGLTYTDGVMMGSLTESLRRRPVVTQPTTVVVNTPARPPPPVHSAPPPPPPPSPTLTNDTHVSTSHATTKRR